jgi:peptidoglycan/LPS O-acetylase OafA/YrhL
MGRSHGRSRGRPKLRLDRAHEQGRSLNNFDLLRLLGATFVVFAHSFPVANRPIPFVLDVPWGEVGVVIFFSISGFLIARSWTYDSQPLSFAVKRGLRLMPALIVALLLTTLVLGPLVTALPLRQYLDAPGTKAYVLDNATFQSNYVLPGVFQTNPFPGPVNGSLWTLPIELKAYCVVLALGLLGVFRRMRLAMPLVAAFLALLTVESVRSAIPLGDHLVAMMVEIQAGPRVVRGVQAGAYQEYARLFTAFAIGASLFAVARWVPLRWSVAAAFMAAWAAAAKLGGRDVAPIAVAWLLPYVVLLLAYRTSHLVRLPRRLGDYSYGIYIFAFPIQQAIAHWIAPTSGWVMFALALPIAVVLAIASWHLVEAPALSLKQRIRQPLERASAAAAAHPLERTALQPDAAD